MKTGRLGRLVSRVADLARIRALMMRYRTALESCDVEGCLACHANVEDISAISLDSIYWGRAEVRRFLQRLFSPAVREDPRHDPLKAHLTVQGDTAIVLLDHIMRLRKPAPQNLDVRVTFTLVRQADDEWRILSSHLSAPRSAFMDPGSSKH